MRQLGLATALVAAGLLAAAALERRPARADDDLGQRLVRIEQAIERLDHRVARLELRAGVTENGDAVPTPAPTTPSELEDPRKVTSDGSMAYADWTIAYTRVLAAQNKVRALAGNEEPIRRMRAQAQEELATAVAACATAQKAFHAAAGR